MIIVSKEAEDEMEEARSYLNMQAARLGERFLDDVECAFSAILEMPFSFPILEITDVISPYRRAILRTFRYAIVFEVLETSTLIVAVAHTSRTPNYWLGRKTTI